MASGEVFVLDAGFFMQAKRGYLAFDLAPRFWEILVELNGEGRIESIDRVSKEINRGKDALTEWANEQFHAGFRSTDDGPIIAAYGKVMKWVNEQKRFSPAEKSRFAKGADGWLIAYAQVKKRTIVTPETPEPDTNRVKIPDVCKALIVKCISPYAMLRALKVKWAK